MVTNMSKYSISKIQSLLNDFPLPGEKAQLEMFTKGRKLRSDAVQHKGQYRKSAVAIVLFKKVETLQCVLIQRPKYNGIHSNQVAFPGGKMEDFDTNLKATALRECIEETGLDKQYFRYLGRLSHLFIPVSKFIVHPFVFHYSTLPIFNPDVREVQEIFSFPIKQLWSKNVIQYTNINMQNNITLKDVPYFAINNKIVWGATAIILNEFKHIFLQKI